MAQLVKNLPANAEDTRDMGSIPVEDPLKKGMATHSSILAWKIPWTEELGRLQSIGLQRVWDTTEHAHTHLLFNKLPIKTNNLIMAKKIHTFYLNLY